MLCLPFPSTSLPFTFLASALQPTHHSLSCLTLPPTSQRLLLLCRAAHACSSNQGLEQTAGLLLSRPFLCPSSTTVPNPPANVTTTISLILLYQTTTATTVSPVPEARLRFGRLSSDCITALSHQLHTAIYICASASPPLCAPTQGQTHPKFDTAYLPRVVLPFASLPCSCT